MSAEERRSNNESVPRDGAHVKPLRRKLDEFRRRGLYDALNGSGAREELFSGCRSGVGRAAKVVGLATGRKTRAAREVA